MENVELVESEVLSDIQLLYYQRRREDKEVNSWVALNVFKYFFDAFFASVSKSRFWEPGMNVKTIKEILPLKIHSR